MLMAEYDYETDIRVQREEAAEKAAKEAAEKAAKEAAEKLKQMAVLMHKNDVADEVICRVTGFNQEELESLYNR